MNFVIDEFAIILFIMAWNIWFSLYLNCCTMLVMYVCCCAGKQQRSLPGASDMSARAAVSTASHSTGSLQCAVLADAQTGPTQTIHWALAVIVFRRPLCYTVCVFVKTKNIISWSSTLCNSQIIILILKMHINLYWDFFVL